MITSSDVSQVFCQRKMIVLMFTVSDQLKTKWYPEKNWRKSTFSFFCQIFKYLKFCAKLALFKLDFLIDLSMEMINFWSLKKAENIRIPKLSLLHPFAYSEPELWDLKRKWTISQNKIIWFKKLCLSFDNYFLLRVILIM